MYTGPPTTYGDLSGAAKGAISIPNPITVKGTAHTVPKKLKKKLLGSGMQK